MAMSTQRETVGRHVRLRAAGRSHAAAATVVQLNIGVVLVTYLAPAATSLQDEGADKRRKPCAPHDAFLMFNSITAA